MPELKKQTECIWSLGFSRRFKAELWEFGQGMTS